jgi:hypothetical protein
MQNENFPPRPNLDFVSVIFGIGSGIIATLVYATYKQREFDRLINKSREIAGNAGDFVDHVGDEAQELTTRITNAAHDGLRTANKASKEAIETVRSSLHG